MCEKCVRDGKMTQEELDAVMAASVVYVSAVLELLHGLDKEMAMNILLSCVINGTKAMNYDERDIIMALLKGFGMEVQIFHGLTDKDNKEGGVH